MSRSQARRTGDWTGRTHATGGGGGIVSVGGQAAANWLAARKQSSTGLLRWHVEIAMGLDSAPVPVEFDEATATRFHLAIYSEEWGVFFSHAGKWSWIRVTDLAFVHTRDDYALLTWVPPLDQVGALLRRIERGHGLVFRRDLAIVQTNLPTAEPAIRAWLSNL
jgi:hypothetical protein